MLFASNILQVQTRSKIFSIGLISIALTACGGGGGSSAPTSSSSGSSNGSSNSGTGGTSGTGSTGSGTSGSGSSPTPASFAYGLSSNASGSAIIQQYSIAASGSLSAVTGSTPIVSSVDAQDAVLKFDPTRKYAYAVNYSSSGSGSIAQYTVGANGVLTPMSTASVATGAVPSDITIDPTGKYLYVVNYGTSTIASSLTAYKIGTGGALSLIGTVAIPTTSYGYAITSTATSVYVTLGSNSNADSTSIAQYSIQSDGTLATSPASTVNLTHFTNGLTIAANGQYAYAPNYVDPSSGATGSGSTIYEYTIGSNGALVPNSTISLSASADPFKIVVDANSKYAYVSGVQSNISEFTIGTDGKLSAMTVPIVTTSSTPHAIIIDPTNKFVYVGDVGASNGITQYSIGSDGSLSQLSFLATAAGIQGVALN